MWQKIVLMMHAQSGWGDSEETAGTLPSFFNDRVNVWPDLFQVNYEYVSYGINFFKDNPDRTI